jgi:WD40 repeat protein
VHTSAGVQFWDATTAEQKRIRLEERDGWRFRSIAYSADGKTLATTSLRFEMKNKRPLYVSSGQVTLWDPATGQVRQRLPEEQTFVSSVAFSPDGKMLAVGLRERVTAEPPTAEERASGKPPKVVGDKRGVVKVWECRP